MSIQVKELQDQHISRWDGFVEICPDATFFHKAGWKTVIERAFSHKTYYLYAEADGEILGVLPLGHIRSRLFGDSLTSFPFCVYGGVAATNEQARRMLTEAAVNLAQQLEVDCLELRNTLPQCDGWPRKEIYVTFRKAIDADPDVNIKAIPRKQRAMVRKGIKAGLVSYLDNHIERFYDVYSTSVRNLGTPVFSRRYFSLLKEVFGEDCEVLTVVKDGRPISSVMSFYFRDEVLPYYGGGNPEARKYYGFDFMYWDLMCRASARGVKMFDYGRSKKGTGSYSFKKNWGFEPRELYYEYHLVQATTVPDINPLNPKYRLFISMWKRLPLPLSRFIGPMIARNLG